MQRNSSALPACLFACQLSPASSAPAHPRDLEVHILSHVEIEDVAGVGVGHKHNSVRIHTLRAPSAVQWRGG